MPAYHSGHLSQTDRPFYTNPLRPQTRDLTVPLAPRNLLITSPYNVAKQDLRWDNPKIIAENSGTCILGCNVYRSFDSPYGPYLKLNTAPITTLFYRDETQEEIKLEEDATPTLRYFLEPDERWLVYAQNRPVVMPGSNGQPTLRVEDVKVEIDNGDGVFRTVPAFRVNGILGEIQLISTPIYSYDLQQILPPRLPVAPHGKVRISYTHLKNHVLTVLNQRVYYKVTTIGFNPANPSVLLETPLEEISERSAFDIEMIDYIWREALLRNRWILEQGGERVKIFIRKWAGQPCETHQENYGQSYNDCLVCFGSNIIGGYEGPYDAIIAPPETEKMIELADMGLHIRYDWATWTMNYPLLNPRDVIVRQNNERYVVGPVNPQGSRGAIYQQHFTMSYIDQGDIRYQIPIDGAETTVPASYDQFREPAPTDASPVVNSKPGIPKERIIRGRTVVFENIMY